MRKEQAELWKALLRLERHYGDDTDSPEMSKGDGKNKEEERTTATASRPYRAAQKLKEATRKPSPRQCEAKGGHRRD